MVDEPFRRLIEKQLLMTVRHKGFSVAMNTFDKQYLDDVFSRDKAPRQVWKANGQESDLDHMRGLSFVHKKGETLKALFLGAHSDDIELGCGGTILTSWNRAKN